MVEYHPLGFFSKGRSYTLGASVLAGRSSQIFKMCLFSLFERPARIRGGVQGAVRAQETLHLKLGMKKYQVTKVLCFIFSLPSVFFSVSGVFLYIFISSFSFLISLLRRNFIKDYENNC